jgi:hypothetical protein
MLERLLGRESHANLRILAASEQRWREPDEDLLF